MRSVYDKYAEENAWKYERKYYIEQQVFPIWTRIGEYYEFESEAKKELLRLNKENPSQLFRMMMEWRVINILEYAG